MAFCGLMFLLVGYCHAQTSLLQQSPELAKAFSIKDTIFKTPYIDVDEWRSTPVRHRYVHGGFSGT